MPTYNFMNKDTDEVEEHVMSYSDIESFLEANPHLKQGLSTPKLIGGRSTDSGRLPEGFKDKMREIQKKHPLAKGVSHLT